jgi:hypothetical protein
MPCTTLAVILGHPSCAPDGPTVTMETVKAYLHNLYRVQPDFVYSVSRDFACACQTPMLVMPDDTPAYPYPVAMDIAALAPKAEVTVYPWREPKDLLVKTVNQVYATSSGRINP